MSVAKPMKLSLAQQIAEAAIQDALAGNREGLFVSMSLEAFAAVEDQALGGAGALYGDLDHRLARELRLAVRKWRERSAAASAGEVDLVRADEVKVEPIRWHWDGYLAGGKLHILAGAPGGGKTTIALSLAAIKTRGAYWPDGTRASVGDVLIWSGEDDPADTLVPRLAAMGADLKRIKFVEGATEIHEGTARRIAFDPARHLDALAGRIADAPPALLIVDPIVSAVAGDSHKNAEVRRGLQPLVDLARLHGIAVLGITHFSKGTQGRDPTERVTGSLAFGALARIVFVASKTREGNRVFMKSKANIANDEGGFEFDVEQVTVPGMAGVYASRIVWGAMVEGNAREVLAEAETEPKEAPAPEPTATDEAMEALRAVLSPGEMLAKEATAVMKQAGFTDKVIRMAREKLGVTVRRAGFGPALRFHWSLASDAHRCPDSPYMPTVSSLETGASMDSEGIYGGEPTADTETF